MNMKYIYPEQIGEREKPGHDVNKCEALLDIQQTEQH